MSLFTSLNLCPNHNNRPFIVGELTKSFDTFDAVVCDWIFWDEDLKL